MMPIADVNPTRRLPILTWGLIAVNVLVFLWELSMPETQLERTFLDLAAVPNNATSLGLFAPETLLDIVRSMFFHGGWDHIIGNMLYLYLFGDNIEDRFGYIGFLLLYFISGFAASYAQILIDPTSTIPMIGASGAIAGVLGAYLVLFPGVKVRGIIPLGRVSTLQEWPAWIVLGMWFVLQLVNGFASLGAQAQYGGGVAFFAHIGGFVAGVVLAFLLGALVPQPPAEQRREMLYERGRRYPL
jgi:membrane associated rhomboid family serine protease